MTDTDTDTVKTSENSRRARYPDFTPDSYDPSRDSSDGWEDFAKPGDENKVVIVALEGEDHGGSRKKLSPNKAGKVVSTFAVGMDARYKGILQRAAITNTPVVRIEGPAEAPTRSEHDARDLATERGWGAHIDAAIARAEQITEARAKRQEEMAQRKAEKEAELAAKRADREERDRQRQEAKRTDNAQKQADRANKVGAKRTFKIGANEFTGKVTNYDAEADKVDVAYTDGAGNEKVRTLPAVKAEEFLREPASAS